MRYVWKNGKMLWDGKYTEHGNSSKQNLPTFGLNEDRTQFYSNMEMESHILGTSDIRGRNCIVDMWK